jgi:nucleoside-diphosphate kinase
MEQTLVILKPDAIQRRYIGEILSRFENKGLKLVALKMIQMDDTTLMTHYADHVDKSFYPSLCEFMKSAPVVVMVLEGLSAISVVRQMMGQTDSKEASPGTVRGDLGLSKGYNLIHGSDSEESATKELSLYFTPQEIQNYTISEAKWLDA